MVGDNEFETQKHLVESIIGIIRKLKEIYQQVDEEDFRKLFLLLDAHKGITEAAIELVRHFDPESKKFSVKYPQMMSILANNPTRQKEFIDAIKNFSPRERGAKGGLRRFHKEFKKERDIKADMIEDYKRIKPWIEDEQAKLYVETMRREISEVKKFIKRHRKLIEKNRLYKIDEDKFEYYKMAIPKPIRRKTISEGKRTLALIWMAREYPLEENTMQQIIHYNPNRLIRKKRGKR